MQQVPGSVRLNTTKLTRPPVTEDYVSRLQLRAQLDTIRRRPLTLVCAPAGYGKTTSISAWLETAGMPHAWLSLGESENDLGEFLTYFVAAIRQAVPEFGTELGVELDRTALPSVMTFVDQFDADLDALNQDIIVVLDDFHLIRNLQVLSLVREVMRHPPTGLHLVLLTRHDPQLPLGEWRARNWMIDIRSSELRFSLEETRALLRSATGEQLNHDAIAALHRNTEGWAAGLRLAIASMVGTEDFEDRLPDFNARNRYVVDYLADEVLSNLDPERQAFLIQTSILDRLSAPLCEALIPSGSLPIDRQAMLAELSRQNLFIVPLDNELQWFRYHHLFGGFLRGRLRREYAPEEVTALHMRASHWFASAGYIDEAIRHAMAAGDMRAAVDLVASTRHHLLNHEQWRRLLALSSLFPEDVTNDSPDLLLIRAWSSHTIRFDQDEIRQLTEAIEALIGRLDLEPSRAAHLLAENDIFRAIPAYFAAHPEQALAYARRGLEGLEKSCYVLRNLGWVYAALSRQMLGDPEGALETVRVGRREDMAFPGGPRVRNAAAAGYIAWVEADLAGVEQTGTHCVASGVNGGQSNTVDWGHYFLAGSHYQRNNLAEALSHARSGFDGHSASRGLPSFYSGLILAQTYCALGESRMAEQTMQLLHDFALDTRSPTFTWLVEAFQAEFDLMQGKTARATRWAEMNCEQMRPSAMTASYAPQLTVVKGLLSALDPASPQHVGDCLNRLHEHLESTHNKRFLIDVLALEALYRNALGDEAASTAALERSLKLAEPSSFIRVYVDLGQPMHRLLARLRGHDRLSEYVQQILAAFPARLARAQAAMVEPLTEREREVLAFLARRYSNKEIAQELTISVVTVKRHTINIYQKLNVQSRRDAVREAERLGILA